MGLEEKHNSLSWTSHPEAAKVCKELVKCGCKEKHVGGHANACLFHSMHRALQLRGNLLSVKNVLDSYVSMGIHIHTCT